MCNKKELSINPDLSALTNREIEILTSIAEGNSYQETANLLHISISTIRYHILRIYNKLDVHSKAAAVAKAIREGFI